MKQKTFRITVKGAKWKYRLLSKDRFRKYYPDQDVEEDPGVTDPEVRIIDFYVKDLTMELIRHEILHAYFSELHLRSADLGQDEFEEICADMVADSWEEIDMKVKTMWERMSGYLDKIEGSASPKSSRHKKDAPP